MEPIFIKIIDIIALFAIFSFLSSVIFGNNIFNVFAENLAIGADATWALFTYLTLLNSGFGLVLGGQIGIFFALIIGLLSFTRLTKYRWLARYPVAIMAGTGLGLIFGLTLRSDLISQIISGVSDVMKGTPDAISSIIVLIGSFATVSYFIYSVRFSKFFRKGPVGFMGKLGIIFLYASFGSGDFITIGSPAALVMDVMARIKSIFGII